jgi:hypothetical protein
VADCTLEVCKLRVEPGNVFSSVLTLFDGSYVAVGDPEQERLPLDASPRFGMMFAENDSASVYYERFIVADRRAYRLNTLSKLLVVAGGVALVLVDDTRWPSGLVAGGILAGFAAEIPAAQARDRFGRAADSYNRSLGP